MTLPVSALPVEMPAAFLGVSRSLTGKLWRDRLDARGLVKRTRSEEDRRVVQVEIARKGLDLLQQLEPHSARMPRAMIGHVAPRKLRQLSKLLAEVLDGMGEFP